jgi:hypothetical protein
LSWSPPEKAMRFIASFPCALAVLLLTGLFGY